MTGRGAALIALGGFILVSIGATAMGFADLRMANADTTTLPPLEWLAIIAVTTFVVLTMVAALNAFLGVGLSKTKTDKDGNEVPAKHKRLRFVAFIFYFFFAFWSVGFGFGFFWKELAGQEYTQNQFKAAIESVSQSVTNASDALATVEASVIGAANTARSRAEEEATNGGTCANRIGSLPGDGPLTRARFAFADRAQALSEDVSSQWTTKLVNERKMLEARILALSTQQAPQTMDSAEADILEQLASAADLKPAERKQVFTLVFDDARDFIAKGNSLRATYAPTFAARLDLLAADVGPSPDNPNQPNPARSHDRSYCWDTILTEKLAASASSLRILKDMPAPEFEFTEGPKATRAASFKLASLKFTDEFGAKEWIALFASIAVDLGIFFLTLIRAFMEPTWRKREPQRPTRMKLGEVHSVLKAKHQSGDG